MHVKYQLNWDNRFVKTVNTKKKLHKFATRNSNLEKVFLSDMHYPTPDTWTNLRSIGLLVIVQPNTKVIPTSDRQTEGQTFPKATIGIFFLKKGKKITKK